MEILISLVIMFVSMRVSALRWRSWRRATIRDLLDEIARISPPLKPSSEGELRDFAGSWEGARRLTEAYGAMLRRIETELREKLQGGLKRRGLSQWALGALQDQILALNFSYPRFSPKSWRSEQWIETRHALLDALKEADVSFVVRGDFETVSHQYGAGFALLYLLGGQDVFFQRDVQLFALKTRLTAKRHTLRRWLTKHELASLENVVQRERAEVDWLVVFFLISLVLVGLTFLKWLWIG